MINDVKHADSVGMMDSAFFVSRKELIDWINKILKINITKVEQCSNGAVYVQLLDIMFPNKSVLNKVKWMAKHEYECIHNFKLIQSVFSKLGVKKYVEVDKLIKGKYQDNLEFLQWFRAFFERTIDVNNDHVLNYDPVDRRKTSILGERGDQRLLNNYLPEWAKSDFPHSNDTKIGHGLMKRTHTRNSANPESSGNQGRKIQKIEKKRVLSISNTNISEKNTHGHLNKEGTMKKRTTQNLNTRLSISNKYASQDSFSSKSINNQEHSKDINVLIEQNKKLKERLENKKHEIMNLQNRLQSQDREKKMLLFQKNFYYNKLRFLELLCNQSTEKHLSIKDIKQIMYARENTYFHQTVSTKETENSHGNGQFIEQNSGNEQFAGHYEEEGQINQYENGNEEEQENYHNQEMIQEQYYINNENNNEDYQYNNQNNTHISPCDS